MRLKVSEYLALEDRFRILGRSNPELAREFQAEAQQDDTHTAGSVRTFFKTMTMKQLTNQIAVVTGANRGIGKAIAMALAAEGASLAICARHAQTLSQVADDLRHR